MGPLLPQGIIQPEWSMVIALLIGMAFGFVLEASGFSSSRKLMGTFYGYDFVVLRVFFTAAITAAIGLIYFEYIGWIDVDMLFVNSTFVGSTIVGGLIMGLGFALGGYCPGTTFCAAAIGKIDAIIFILGMMIGIFIFSEAFPLLEGFYNSNALGPIKIHDSLGITDKLFVFIISVVALVVFYVASYIRRRVKKVEY